MVVWSGVERAPAGAGAGLVGERVKMKIIQNQINQDQAFGPQELEVGVWSWSWVTLKQKKV